MMTLANMFSRLSMHTFPLFVALVIVLAFQVYHVYGLHVSKDLPLWDESAYVGWGDEFLQDGKVGSITNAPFYHVLYGMVISAVGLLPGFHAVQYLLKLTLTVLVVLLVFRFSRSGALSLVLGVFFAYSYYHLNIDVLVYYGALVPYLAAILVARPSPALSLGLSFLAGLGRLEYMAVPVLHAGFLVWSHVAGTSARRSESQEPRMPGGPKFPERIHLLRGFVGEARGATTAVLFASVAAIVWVFNLFVLTRITVWQFHNRVWFAWSQNYAFFRYLTGRDSGGNPWLDHQTIAERDFPGAQSLSEAFAVNPVQVVEHTWFNLRELPEYLAGFAIAHQNASEWKYLPLYILGAIVGIAGWRLFKDWPDWQVLANGLKSRGVEIVLCLGGVLAAAPAVLVSTKTNYIMSLLPAALFVIGGAHLLARRWRLYARWSETALIAVAAAFAIFTFIRPPAYSAQQEKGPVYKDVVAMRALMAPFQGLKILGVSTASYVNYLGRENGHVFIEPLAISPINRQADDLSLSGLIRTHDPDVLLINSHWQSSQSYAIAVAGFDFDAWEPHPLNDGTLYTKRGLIIRPVYGDAWFGEEALDGRTWRWSRGDADIALPNAVPGRRVVLRFRMRSVGEREIKISLNGRALFTGRLGADANRDLELNIERLAAGDNKLVFQTDRPAMRPGNGDTRELAFMMENVAIVYEDRE